MPTPKKPRRLPPEVPPALNELFERLLVIEQDQRTMLLVDYLEDLRREYDWVAAELKKLGFCAPCYLSGLDDGDDHDCVEPD